MNTKKRLAALALIPTLSVAAILTSAYAATGTTTGNGTTTQTTKSGWRGLGKKKDTTMLSQDLAPILGLSAADIKTQLDNGQTLNAIIASAGKDKATVMQALVAARLADMKAKLSSEVASGKITQAQADKILASMQNHTRVHAKGHTKKHLAKHSPTASTTNSY